MNKKTPLYKEHIKLGAKMTPFSGYEMPVWYTSLKEEHRAVRNHAGVFDISHMCTLLFQGEHAYDALQYFSCNSLEKTKNGIMVYSMILNEEGHILDDVMIGQLSPGTMIMIVNAGNAEKIYKWVSQKMDKSISIENYRNTHALLAIQGPEAIQKISQLFSLSFDNIPRFSVKKLSLNNIPCILMRTGYTGEDGVEVLIHNDHIDSVWDQVISSGVTPCGLGARDTLRLEAGLPLYGQEFSEKSHPFMTRYQWVVRWGHDFIGKNALEQHKDTSTFHTIGLEMIERVIPRTGYKIEEGGQVTSGTLSPTLDLPIAMAIAQSNVTIGDVISVEIRGKLYSAKVVSIPFIKKRE